MNVGDIVTEQPTFYSKAGIEDTGPRKGRVTFVHPEGRFYTVEFRSKVTGQTWRESFYFSERRGNPNASRTLDEGYRLNPSVVPVTRRDYSVKLPPKARGGIYDRLK